MSMDAEKLFDIAEKTFDAIMDSTSFYCALGDGKPFIDIEDGKICYVDEEFLKFFFLDGLADFLHID